MHSGKTEKELLDRRYLAAKTRKTMAEEALARAKAELERRESDLVDLTADAADAGRDVVALRTRARAPGQRRRGRARR